MPRIDFLRFTRTPPVSTGSELSPRSSPPDEDGRLTAMAKGVNDVLNYYIQVTDTKASIFIAGSVAAASFLLTKFPDTMLARALYFIGAGGLGVGLILATFVVLPRLPGRSGGGSVFWGDIAGCGDPSEYCDRFGKSAGAGLLDEEYSALNFHTSRILRQKIRVLRAAILCFLGGVIAALAQYLLHG
jgi:hypothetical protein